MTRMNAGRAAAVGLLVAGCGETPTNEAAREPVMPPHAQTAYATPLQGRIAQLIAARETRGDPIPSVSFEFHSAQGSSLADLERKRYGPGEGYAYTARTVIHYDGPSQAGLQKWPDLTLRDAQARKLGAARTNLADLYALRIAKARPGFWDRYRLGFEPRTYTITESGSVLYPSLPSLVQPLVSAPASTQNDLLLGFSVPGPGLHFRQGFGLEDVEELEFRVDLDWGLGVRLPISGQVDSPQPYDEGSTYSASSLVHGLNWSPAQYSAAGLAEQAGNEAYMFFVAQACAELSGIIDWEECRGPNIQESRDFTVPLGAGATVALSTISYPLLDGGLAGVDFDVTPSAGSDKITAQWNVSGEAFGGGNLQYSSATLAEVLSPVVAVDGPGNAHYALGAFRYYFTQFAISPAVTVWVDVEIPIPFAPNIDWDDEWSFGLGTYDLSALAGALDLSVGVHDGTSPTGLALDVPIQNVAPTGDIALVGGQEIIINGVSTIIANVGDPFTFTGTSHDPGRDGLTLSWDWGDGLPAPDETMLYPLAAPIGPNDATDVRVHAFDRACLYDVIFRSVDDDAAAGQDKVMILVTEEGHASRLEGYWQRQLARTGASVLDAAVVSCYLAMVGRVSTVFNEARDASTFDAALAVANVSANAGSEVEQLDRELLVAWLNFASGAIGYQQSVDTDKDGVADTPFNQMMAAAEAVRLDPAATPGTLKAFTALVHRISVQFTGGGAK